MPGTTDSIEINDEKVIKKEIANAETEKTVPEKNSEKTDNSSHKAYSTVALNIRAEKSVNSEVVGTVFKNEDIRIKKTDDPDWYEVLTTNGIKGFCVSDYIVVE